MSINVKLVSNTVNKVTYSNNTTPIVLKNDAFITKRLASLTDVNMANTADGTTLVYANGTFTLESPDNLTFNSVDGGSF